MEARHHSRPLWVGLAACTFFVPVLMTIFQFFSAESVIVAPALVFIVGSLISGAATIFAATPAVLLLSRVDRLNAIVLCLLGAVVGALALGWFAYVDNYFPQMGDRSFALWVARQAAFKAMPLGAAHGFLSAAALCVGAGIPIRRIEAAAAKLD